MSPRARRRNSKATGADAILSTFAGAPLYCLAGFIHPGDRLCRPEQHSQGDSDQVKLSEARPLSVAFTHALAYRAHHDQP